ncbi:hypothetical protein PN499_27515 [Kamptonema animale CS-326]|nr:hypothetical protein [Kamptonema animale CS-326]
MLWKSFWISTMGDRIRVSSLTHTPHLTRISLSYLDVVGFLIGEIEFNDLEHQIELPCDRCDFCQFEITYK